MKLTTLTKASQLLADIKQLDEQIIQLDKIAMSVCDKKQKGSVTLSFEKEKKPKPDGEDSEYRGIYGVLMGSYSFREPEIPTDSHKFDIDEVDTLVICGSLIQVKKDRRKMLVTQLLELGYTY
jgi:hypothetical protein